MIANRTTLDLVARVQNKWANDKNNSGDLLLGKWEYSTNWNRQSVAISVLVEFEGNINKYSELIASHFFAEGV